ncbi:hypothetical protein QBC47DRAFT_355061 [Echria macrotheca]|uniref:HNH nuclease domain-containing protein n=1 Tax=Echria macrotheca TaxID=438768 RepID=A0AAJ0F5P6_9PEZI|nr:hypothetical protein QBC47DRAFT_355061 [Echria macrotheca]
MATAALPAFTPPAVEHGSSTAPRDVRFRHPAYPSSAPDLLVLMAADGDGGLDFDLALTSCCIITATDWDSGYLAQKHTSTDDDFYQIIRPPDGILRGREFFFCVRGQDPFSYKYPVLPSFQHWRFPHGDYDEDGTPRGNLPPPWKSLQLPEFVTPRPVLKGSAAAMDRDVTCRISGYMDAVDNAHLVPQSERLWFVSNRMERYCRRPLEISAINDDKNLLLLRKDLHSLFDARRFTLVPRRFGACPPESAELVTHVLLPSGSPELVGLYHNRLPQQIRGISVELLFARFAWSLFTDEHIPFLGSGLEYVVRIWDEAKGEARNRTIRGPDARRLAQIFDSSRSQSRSVSPKKRSLSTQDDDEDVPEGDDWPDNGDSSHLGQDDDAQNSPPRGRPRKRRCDSFGREDQDVPSLSSSFISVAGSSPSSRPDGQVSQPLTPARTDNIAPVKSGGKGGGDGRTGKRMHVEEELT